MEVLATREPLLARHTKFLVCSGHVWGLFFAVERDFMSLQKAVRSGRVGGDFVPVVSGIEFGVSGSVHGVPRAVIVSDRTRICVCGTGGQVLSTESGLSFPFPVGKKVVVMEGSKRVAEVTLNMLAANGDFTIS